MGLLSRSSTNLNTVQRDLLIICHLKTEFSEVIQCYDRVAIVLAELKERSLGPGSGDTLPCPEGRGGRGANSAAHFLGKPDTSAAVLCQRTHPQSDPWGGHEMDSWKAQQCRH